MASASSLRRDDHLVGTLNRRPAPRMFPRAYRPASKRDAVLLGTTSFCGDSVYDVAGKFWARSRNSSSTSIPGALPMPFWLLEAFWG